MDGNDDSTNYFDDSLEEQLDEIPNSPEFSLNSKNTQHTAGPSVHCPTESLFLNHNSSNSFVLPTFTIIKKEAARGKILDLREKLKKLNSKEFKNMRIKDFKEGKKKLETGLLQTAQNQRVGGNDSRSSHLAQRLKASQLKICAMIKQVSELESVKKTKSKGHRLIAENQSLYPSDTVLDSSNSVIEHDNDDISIYEIPDSLENSLVEEPNASHLLAGRKTVVDQSVTVIEDESMDGGEMDEDSLESNSFHSIKDEQVNETVMVQEDDDELPLKLYRPNKKPSRANPAIDSLCVQEDAKQLFGFLCKECKDFYATRDLSTEHIKLLITKCNKHRGNHYAHKTPKNFWEIDFPSHQCNSNKAPNLTNLVSENRLDSTYDEWEASIHRNYRPSNVLHSTRH